MATVPAKLVSKGYGQVEANRLSGITFGNIEAQAPAFEDAEGSTPIAELENGRFLCVIADKNGVSPMGRIAVIPGEADATATPYLVYSEKKLYDERDGYCDFVDRAADKVDGKIYPRLIGLTTDSCVLTTNTVDATLAEIKALGEQGVGGKLYINDDGYLSTTQGTNTCYAFIIDKVYTMPDGQDAVKIHCVRQ